MTLPTDDELRAMLAGATKGPWSNDLEKGPVSGWNLRAHIGLWAQSKWDDAYEADPDDIDAADDYAWIAGIWGEISDKDVANLELMTLAPDLAQTVLNQRTIIAAQAATVERLTRALTTITNNSPFWWRSATNALRGVE